MLECSTTKLKKHLRRANKVIRQLNDNIKNDDLWKGRFVAAQERFSYHRYSDGSGIFVQFIIRLTDLKTNQTKLVAVNNYEIQTAKLFWEMNDFIVTDCKVWEKDDPRQDKKVYR